MYEQSELVKNLKKSGKLFAFDIDGTLSVGSLEARENVKKYARERGGLLFASARSPELMISSGVLKNSHEFGFTRPEPHSHFEKNSFTFAPLETIHEFKDLLDPDAISSFGVGIYLKQNSHFVEDRTFTEPSSHDSWSRDKVMILLRHLDEGDILEYLPVLEHEGMYNQGKVDIIPLPFRIQINFPSLELKLNAMKKIEEARTSSDPEILRIAQHIIFVDESNPDRIVDGKLEPRYILYLMPEWATKDKALDHIVRKIEESGTQVTEVFYAGDTLTDVRAGVYGGHNTPGTFILVGGSRLSNYIIDPKLDTFAGESLVWLKQALEKTDKKGVYNFALEHGIKRRIVIGDEAYPGTIGSDSILADFESQI